MKNFSEYSVDKWLELHAKDKHVPGAGSLVAFNALVASSPLLKIISNNIRKRSLSKHHQFLQEKKDLIEKEIIPRLMELYDEDIIVFDAYFNLRKDAKIEKDPIKKASIEEKVDKAMEPCIDVPLEIFQLSHDLFNISAKLFAFGFFGVASETYMALANCKTAMEGCIFIGEHNLCYMEKTDWSLRVAKRLENLRSLSGEIREQMIRYENIPLSVRQWNWYGKDAFVEKYCYSYREKNLNTRQIEKLTIDMLIDINNDKKGFWRTNTPVYYLDMIKPKKLLEVFGYEYIESSSLGRFDQNGQWIEIAGITDHEQKIVKVSTSYSPESRYFTLCHELGHVIMHNERRMYRDGPLDGKFNRPGQDWIEYQANTFAKFFSMPGELVIELFESYFGTRKWELNSDTLFMLNKGNAQEFLKKYPYKRSVSLLLAGLTVYNQQEFPSLAQVFGVSKTAMAIRLEELGLIDFRIS